MLPGLAVAFDTFLYLRHGQSEANLRGLICGRHCDSRLTELGREQARLAAIILGPDVSCRIDLCQSPGSRPRDRSDRECCAFGSDYYDWQIERLE